MPQTYKMEKRDKEEEGRHYFLFLNQSSLRLEGIVCGMHHLSVCVHKVRLYTRLTSRLPSSCPAVPVQLVRDQKHFRQSFVFIPNPHFTHV